MMITTFLSFIVSAWIFFFASENDLRQHINTFFLSAMPGALILTYALVYIWSLAPLQKTEQNVCPRLLNLLKKDPWLGFNHFGLMALSFLALAIGFVAPAISTAPFHYLVGIWIILIGVSFDLLMHFVRRVLLYLNPFMVNQLIRQAAKRSVSDKNQIELCEWIDALAEVGSRSLAKGVCSLCNEALDEMREVARFFLETSKGLGESSQSAHEGGPKDKITFTLFYLFQQVEMLFNQALAARLEPVCSKSLTVFGKLTLDTARYDISLASFPLQYVGRLSFSAHQQKLQEIGIKATCLYLEIAKSLLKDIDISYLEIQAPFFTMIHYMDEHAKEAFKQNKETPIRALVQPFQDLKELFTADKVAKHQDTAVICADIDRVLAEFSALEMVLRTIPPIPTFADKEQPSAPAEPN